MTRWKDAYDSIYGEISDKQLAQFQREEREREEWNAAPFFKKCWLVLRALFGR